MSDIYCAEQIKIPPTYPYIIKQYAKAAIRTQPYDLLQWTCAYFRALANCDIPPVKERLEYPPFSHPSGITPGYLKTLVNVFGHVENVCLRRILSSWQGISLPETTLFRMLLVGKFLPEKECNFYKFLAIACGFLGKNLFETMIYVCELLTEEPEGGSAMIPVRTFVRLYEYLAMLDCSGECPYVIMEDDTKEISPPSESSTLTSTFDSRLYVVPSAVEEEEESGKLDVCPFTPSESRSSGILQVLKDYSGDARPSEVDEAQQEVVVEALKDQIDVGSMVSEKLSEKEREAKSESRVNVGRDSAQPAVPDIHFLDTDYSVYDRDSFVYYGEEDRGETTVSYEEIDDYEPIGLENILHGICECLEPVRETVRTPTPPPPDPFEGFLERMKQEVDEGRLEMRFRVEGIGPPVSTNRITAVLGLSCVFALWFSSHVSVHANQPIMFRNPDPFSDTEIEDGLSERWLPSGIFPDTLWCGLGNIASGPDQLGPLKSTDACCRTHDMCPDIIEAHKTKHGLTNSAYYTRLSCDCDEKFRQCLKNSTDTISAKLVGEGYFTLIRTKCFRVDYPIVDCIERSWILRRCKKYRLDTKGQKKYQWFDLAEY